MLPHLGFIKSLMRQLLHKDKNEINLQVKDKD